MITNPKSLAAKDKTPLHLWPFTATDLGAAALGHGSKKYGKHNYRHTNIQASTYFDAISRHLNAWWEGEDGDKESGLSHLAHILANVAILLDSKMHGTLVDDRK